MKYLEELENVLYRRKQQLPEKSYTANLFRDGEDRILKKIVEETGEIILAAKNKETESLLHEAGDLIFHLQVLLVDQGLSIVDVVKELEQRHR